MHITQLHIASYLSPPHLLLYLRVRPLGSVMEVIFPSGNHVVGRSGTSFSGARAECAWDHEEPQDSAKAAPRHQDRDMSAIAGSCSLSLSLLRFLSQHVLDLSQALKMHGGKVNAINQSPSATHTHPQ